MSLRFIVGKPGGGKSFVATKMILDDLAHSEVYVVTNIPLVWGECNAYLQEHHPDVSVDLHERLRVLDDREVFEFYRYRSGDLELEASPDSGDGKKMRKADFIEVMKEQFQRISEDKEFQRPCHYYIDEAHNYFNAREWQEIGRALLYYVSQHRHLHDNIFLITQALANVEKQLKSVAQDYNVMRNLAKESIGIFAQRGVFRRRAYYSEPNGTAQHYEQSHMKLDFDRVGKCYKTCGALGLGYDQAEKDRKPFKLPYWSMWAGAAAAMVAIILAIKTVPSLVAGGLMTAVTPDTYSQKMEEFTGAASSGEETFLSEQSQELTVFEPVVDNQVQWNMYYSLNGVHVIGLTDGRKIKSNEDWHGLEAITQSYVQVAGERYYWKQAKIKPLRTEKPVVVNES